MRVARPMNGSSPAEIRVGTSTKTCRTLLAHTPRLGSTFRPKTPAITESVSQRSWPWDLTSSLGLLAPFGKDAEASHVEEEASQLCWGRPWAELDAGVVAREAKDSGLEGDDAGQLLLEVVDQG